MRDLQDLRQLLLHHRRARFNQLSKDAQSQLKHILLCCRRSCHPHL